MTLFDGIIAVAVVTIPSAISALGSFFVMRQSQQNKREVEDKIDASTQVAERTHNAVNSRMDELIKNMNETWIAKIQAIEEKFSAEKTAMRSAAKRAGRTKGRLKR